MLAPIRYTGIWGRGKGRSGGREIDKEEMGESAKKKKVEEKWVGKEI